MNSYIRAANKCLYIEQDNNIVPINLDDIVKIGLWDDSDLDRSTGYGPMYEITIFILDKANRQIKQLDLLIIREDGMISDLREVLSSCFFSIEVFKGVYHFYNSSFDWKPNEKFPGWFNIYRNDLRSPIEMDIDNYEYPLFLTAKEKYLKQKEKPHECTHTMDR